MKISGTVLFSFAFRPLFMLAGVFGIVSVAWWGIVYLCETAHPPTGMDPVSWHSHEMIYGFAAAAIGGFLLTAGASWTKRPPIAGNRLLLLVLAWILGRLAVGMGGVFGLVLTAVLDLSYLAILTCLFGNEVIKSRDRRNYKIIAILALLCGLNLLFHLEVSFVLPIPPRTSIRGALMVVLLLIATIGGRIVPNFTRNWIVKKDSVRWKPPADFSSVDKVAMVALGLWAVCWTVDPFHVISIVGAVGVAVLQLIRLYRWRSPAAFDNVLLAVLHIGYAWIPLSILMTALASYTEWIMFSATMHGLSIGAIGLLIIAVGSRAALGHTGRELKAGTAMSVSYALIVFSVLFRILAGLPELYTAGLLASAIAWCLGLVVFLIRYYPILTQPGKKS